MTERAQALEAAAEMLWVVVANVSGGDWSKQTPEWQEAAARWRDAYFAAVQPPPPGGSPTTAWIPTDGCDCATCNVARRSTPVEPAVTPTLQDALSALRYIRETHGALYGVGWDRLLPVEPAGASHTGWGPDKTRDCHCTACQGEPAGASESPSEMDSGIVLLVSAASAASGYLERQQPDLAAWLWNAVQLVLNSQSTPVSPVAPEPPTDPACKRCGHTLSAHRPEFGACDGSTRPCACPEFVQTTGEPAPCVWREDGPTMATGCGVRNSMLPRNPIKQGWKACPYCKAPLNE